MKNLTLRAGVVYSKIKFNYQNTLFIQPYFSFSEDASVIAFTVFTARLKGMDVKYTDGKFVCASEKVAERFNPWLEEKKEKGFNKMDHTFIATTLDTLEAWNMSFGLEMEIYRNCFCTVDAHFLGNKNISMTTGLSFRLFGQK